MEALLVAGLELALQGLDPGRWDLMYALLGIVLGPATVWGCITSLRSGEGDFDRQLAPWMRFSAVVVLLAGAAVTLAAGYWLVKWLPEYFLW